MADITITLSAKKAITNAQKLIAALDRVEGRVKKLANTEKKISLSAKLNLTRVAGDMNDIQKLVTIRGKTRPIMVRAILKLDQRAKPLVETIHTRGKGKTMGYATKDPSGIPDPRKQILKDIAATQKVVNEMLKQAASLEKTVTAELKKQDMIKKGWRSIGIAPGMAQGRIKATPTKFGPKQIAPQEWARMIEDSEPFPGTEKEKLSLLKKFADTQKVVNKAIAESVILEKLVTEELIKQNTITSVRLKKVWPNQKVPAVLKH